MRQLVSVSLLLLLSTGCTWFPRDALDTCEIGGSVSVRLRRYDRMCRVARTRYGHRLTPLAAAVSQNDAEAVRILLDRGADIDEEDEKGHSALYEAAMFLGAGGAISAHSRQQQRPHLGRADQAVLGARLDASPRTGATFSPYTGGETVRSRPSAPMGRVASVLGPAIRQTAVPGLQPPSILRVPCTATWGPGLSRGPCRTGGSPPREGTGCCRRHMPGSWSSGSGRSGLI